ncbi:hypothetical protein FF041_32720 [Streptomyces jumonjinensis]|uniref:Uncharacterized protein n=1 Tax=Streptomyces jumonjinensis TaxID=1945 RepID=A0A646KR80_STRJU|nr:hypothetical protein [Streptomyces jumonjinensis]
MPAVEPSTEVLARDRTAAPRHDGPARARGYRAGAGRAAAIRRHVLEMPAPVVAGAFGYHQVTTAKPAAQAGAPGVDTPPGTACRHHQAGSQEELTTVE